MMAFERRSELVAHGGEELRFGPACVLRSRPGFVGALLLVPQFGDELILLGLEDQHVAGGSLKPHGDLDEEDSSPIAIAPSAI